MNFLFYLNLKVKYSSNRTDPEHRQKFTHPTTNNHRSSSTHFAATRKENCRYGNKCNKYEILFDLSEKKTIFF